MKTKSLKLKYQIIMIVLSLAFFCGIVAKEGLVSYANNDDGTYSANCNFFSSSDIGQSMIESYMDKNIVIEKIGSLNYVYLSTAETGILNDITLFNGNYKVGSATINSLTTMFTIEDSNLTSTFIATAYVPIMGSSVEFELIIDTDSIVKTSSSVSNFGDRPAEYQSIISYSSSTDFGTNIQGSVVSLPTATASAGGRSSVVEVSAYYQKGSEKVSVDITYNSITLSYAGNYYIVYTAYNSYYTTSEGNDSETSEEFMLFSIGNSNQYPMYESNDGVVSLGDPNFILSGFAILNSNNITSGNDYNDIQSLLKKTSTNFDIYSIYLINDSEETVTYSGSLELSIKINGTYDRSNTSLYYYSNGKLTKVNSKIIVNKIIADTNLNGIFVVVENNVQTISVYFVIIIVFAIILFFSILGIITILILKQKGVFKYVKKGEQNV